MFKCAESEGFVKRVLGIILAGLGGFLVALALLLKAYVVPNLAVAPLSPGEDTDGVTISLNEGMATKLFDPATLTERTNVPLVSTRFTRGDVQAAETAEAKDQNLAIYDSFSRLVDPAGTVVSADTLRVAFDRVTSELKNCCGANYDGDEVVFEGINPLKFPMFTQAVDYDYFDTSLGKAWPAVYQGQEELFGATVYKFLMTIPPTMTSEMEVPGDLVGSEDASYKAGRYYANNRTLYVEPTTGSIVKGVEEQKQTLRGPAGEDKVTIIEATIGAPDSEVQKSVDSAMESASLINTLNQTVPLVAGILGVVALVGGFLLARRPDEETVPEVTDQWGQ